MSVNNNMQEHKKYKAETDFNELRTNPSKLFPLYFVFTFAILLLVGMTYVSQLTTVGKNSVAPSLPLDSASLVTDLPLQSPRVVPPTDVMKASVSTPEVVATGRTLFKANCASCHGESGMGDGPTSATLNPKPRNFTSEKGWTNGSKISQIYKTLELGIVANGMASFNYFTPQDRFALIHFIRTLHANQPVDSVEELKQLDTTFGLSKGMTVAGQIPVRKAKEIIVKENGQRVINVDEYIARTEQSSDRGAKILRDFASDEHRVFGSMLNRSQGFFDSNEFVKSVAVNPLQFGFKASVTHLSADEWASLYSYLLATVK